MSVEDRADRHIWLRRLRWRLRGSWQPPAFAALTAAEAVLIALLPFAGDRAPEPIGALLIATFFNLLAVAVAAPLLGRLLRRGDPSLPRGVARDRGGVIALLAVLAALVAGGLAHRPALVAEQRALRDQARAARDFFARRAPASVRGDLRRLVTWKIGPGVYRTCLPGPDPDRSLCVIVEAGSSPPTVTLDRSREPN